MLTETEFRDKRHVILDKHVETYVMERYDKGWKIISISKLNRFEPEVSTEIVKDSEAYEFYKERMESFGYKQFPITVEI